MKTALVLLCFFFLALAQCHVPPVHEKRDSAEKREHGHEDCKPTNACIAKGGYCIRSKNKGNCNGLLFPKKCKSDDCSCCVENKCDSNPCGPNSQCTSTPGSYECACNAGYQNVSGNCVDINECAASNVCGPNSQCQNTDGSYLCVCDAGYQEVSGTCVDIDECLAQPPLCTAPKRCFNNIGSYACLGKCATDNELITGTDLCGILFDQSLAYDPAKSFCTTNAQGLLPLTTVEEIEAARSFFLTGNSDITWIDNVAPPLSGSSGNCPVMAGTLQSQPYSYIDCATVVDYIICRTPSNW